MFRWDGWTSPPWSVGSTTPSPTDATERRHVLAPIVARWTDWSGAGLEHLVLELGDDAIAADGVVLSGGEQLFAARYRVICDAGWRVRRAEVELYRRRTSLAAELRCSGLVARWRGKAAATAGRSHRRRPLDQPVHQHAAHPPAGSRVRAVSGHCRGLHTNTRDDGHERPAALHLPRETRRPRSASGVKLLAERSHGSCSISVRISCQRLRARDRDPPGRARA